MKVVAKTKNGWFVESTLEELNSVSGLSLDKYGIGDTVDITPNLALAVTVAQKEAELNQRIATAKAALEAL
jgi:hypothetical protein